MTHVAPESFADAIVALDSLIPTATKQYLRSLDETGLDREYWGLGLAVNNVLGLSRDGGPLAQWFEERGVVHPDDMSSSILRAYWRRLQGLPAEAEPELGRRVAGPRAAP